jgi:hypothetical protein
MCVINCELRVYNMRKLLRFWSNGVMEQREKFSLLTPVFRLHFLYSSVVSQRSVIIDYFFHSVNGWDFPFDFSLIYVKRGRRNFFSGHRNATRHNSYLL